MVPGRVAELETASRVRRDLVIGVFGGPECGQTPSWRGLRYRQGYLQQPSNWKPELEEKRAQ